MDGDKSWHQPPLLANDMCVYPSKMGYFAELFGILRAYRDSAIFSDAWEFQWFTTDSLRLLYILTDYWEFSKIPGDLWRFLEFPGFPRCRNSQRN